MTIWSTVTLDVRVEYDDFERARERAIELGEQVDVLVVPAEVDIDEALEEATAEQLRDALGRGDGPDYTQDQLNAIHDCFAAVAAGDTHTANALLCRVFEHAAQVTAAEHGMTCCQRLAA